MTEEEKVLALKHILRQLNEDDKQRFEDMLSADESKRIEFQKFKEILDAIDFSYKSKSIKKHIDKIDLSYPQETKSTAIDIKEIEMNEKPRNLIQYLIMVLIAGLISVLVFSLMNNSSTEDPKANTEPESEVKIENAIEESTSGDNTIQSDEEVKDIEIMGIAINRSGYYVLPYSASKLKGVFGSNNTMTNNLPLNVVWDDKELGFAIANFADENLERLPSISYRFSKADYFLGEELFIVHSSRDGVKVNKGIVVADSKEANRMSVHLSFEEEMYGAVLLDRSGLIVGLIDGVEKDGNVKVVKSKALHKMITEMNMDKGVTYISMPNQNYLNSKTNAQRVESIVNYVAWFSAAP